MASIPTVPRWRQASARLVEIPGMVPSLTNLPKGCAFAPRCELAIQRCARNIRPCRPGDRSSGGVAGAPADREITMTETRALLE